MITIPWDDVWSDVAARVAAHRRAARGHLLTEDTVRLETVLALDDRGVAATRLAAEVLVPVLAGGKVDLVVDPPAGTVIELKYPRDSRTGISPDTMTFGELLRDFVRVAVVSGDDRWVVQVLNPRLVRYLDGVCHRHGLHWPTARGDVLELRRETLSALPGTATRAIGSIAAPLTVTATCAVVAPIDDELTLYAHQVEGAARGEAPVASPALTVTPPPPPAPTQRSSGVTRDGARREILEAARAIVTRTRRNEFTMPDVIAEMRRCGTGYTETTIRTMMSSHLCAEATGDGVARYTDLARVGRGLYKLTDWTSG